MQRGRRLDAVLIETTGLADPQHSMAVASIAQHSTVCYAMLCYDVLC
jgi:G3E family GTPase